MTPASWVNSAALGAGCLASAGAWARTSRAGPYTPAATARTPTQSHRRALRTKWVYDMVLSPLSWAWALDRRMGGCPPGEMLVEDRAPRPCDGSGANESINSFRASVPPTATQIRQSLAVRSASAGSSSCLPSGSALILEHMGWGLIQSVTAASATSRLARP